MAKSKISQNTVKKFKVVQQDPIVMNFARKILNFHKGDSGWSLARIMAVNNAEDMLNNAGILFDSGKEVTIQSIRPKDQKTDWNVEKPLSDYLDNIANAIVNATKKLPENLSESKKIGKYDINYGTLGNGLTFWDRNREEHNDYKTIAHIAPDGKVTWRDKQLPQNVKDFIKKSAEGDKVIRGKIHEENLSEKAITVRKNLSDEKIYESILSEYYAEEYQGKLAGCNGWFRVYNYKDEFQFEGDQPFMTKHLDKISSLTKEQIVLLIREAEANFPDAVVFSLNLDGIPSRDKLPMKKVIVRESKFLKEASGKQDGISWKTLDPRTAGISGTSKQGYLTIDNKTLVKVLGRVTVIENKDGNEELLWVIQFENQKAIIYQSLEHVKPSGKNKWVVAGKDETALKFVLSLFGLRYESVNNVITEANDANELIALFLDKKFDKAIRNKITTLRVEKIGSNNYILKGPDMILAEFANNRLMLTTGVTGISKKLLDIVEKQAKAKNISFDSVPLDESVNGGVINEYNSNDNLLDGITFQELIDTVYSNEKDVNDNSVKKTFETLLKAKIKDAQSELKKNMKQLVNDSMHELTEAMSASSLIGTVKRLKKGEKITVEYNDGKLTAEVLIPWKGESHPHPGYISKVELKTGNDEPLLVTKKNETELVTYKPTMKIHTVSAIRPGSDVNELRIQEESESNFTVDYLNFDGDYKTLKSKIKDFKQAIRIAEQFKKKLEKSNKLGDNSDQIDFIGVYEHKNPNKYGVGDIGKFAVVFVTVDRINMASYDMDDRNFYNKWKPVAQKYLKTNKTVIGESILSEADDIAKYVDDIAVNKFIKKYPNVKKSMISFLKGNSVHNAYVKWINWKEKNEDRLGGEPEYIESPSFGNKTFYEFDWTKTKSGQEIGFAMIFQYLWNMKNEQISEKLSKSRLRKLTKADRERVGGRYIVRENLSENQIYATINIDNGKVKEFDIQALENGKYSSIDFKDAVNYKANQYYINNKIVKRPEFIKYLKQAKSGNLRRWGITELKRGKEQSWQKDPDKLKTNKVQVWSNTGVIISRLSLKDARRMIDNGKAFVISDQAIGYYE